MNKFFYLLFIIFCPITFAAENLPAVKTILPAEPDSSRLGPNRLGPFDPYIDGCTESDGIFWCDNGKSTTAVRGVWQKVQLAQKVPTPIYISGESLAEEDTGERNFDYSLYVDLLYTDGTCLWTQNIPFSTGSHGWEKKGFYIFPEKPIQQATFYALYRNRSGKAGFRNLALQELGEDENQILFDAFPLESFTPLEEETLTFQLRDVKEDSPFWKIGDERTADGRTISACGIDCTFLREERTDGDFYRAELRNPSDEDKILTLLVSYPIRRESLFWLENGLAEGKIPIQPGKEYFSGTTWTAGTSGHLSRWPFAAVAPSSDSAEKGVMLGIDPDYPAFYRLFYNEPAGELVLAYDLALTREKPSAELKFFTVPIDAPDGFAEGLSAYYRFYPNHFQCRPHSQGNWMPFAKISAIPHWEDFGFKFKEGDNETAWDDEHGIITFRYTEPMTWWMPLASDEPHTILHGLEKAKKLADEGNGAAMAFFTSGHKDAEGNFCGTVIDTPWCSGIVWSLNDMPGLEKLVQSQSIPRSELYPLSGFGYKWNAGIANGQHGEPKFEDGTRDFGKIADFFTDSAPKTGLDGEYIDTSEGGYITKELDFDRNHFAGAASPLVFDRETLCPGIFRGLIAYEYAQKIAEDVHLRGHLMMANSTPDRYFWLVPCLDVIGTETKWNPQGNWSPMPLAGLYYRRALTGKKPYCFLMDTDFSLFSSKMSEKYMNRALAFGMFPGFFSADASTGQYFENPELYERDRPLFRQYIPIIREVAEAGWEPLTLAHAEEDRLTILRFGGGETVYLTIYNSAEEPQTALITLESRLLAKWGNNPITVKNRLTGEEIPLSSGTFSITLPSEKTAVIKITGQ